MNYGYIKLWVTQSCILSRAKPLPSIFSTKFICNFIHDYSNQILPYKISRLFFIQHGNFGQYEAYGICLPLCHLLLTHLSYFEQPQTELTSFCIPSISSCMPLMFNPVTFQMICKYNTDLPHSPFPYLSPHKGTLLINSSLLLQPCSVKHNFQHAVIW